MTTTLTFYDAAFPPASEPPGCDGVAFYIGGDTPHVWTLAEIEATSERFRLPIFVRSDPEAANVAIDVSVAISRLEAISAPRGCLVALDSETSVDVNYVAQFYYELRAAGYTLIDYGSVSSVFGNQIPDGYYWGAHWTNRPGVEAGTQMTQWESFDAYDESTALATLPFWDTGLQTPVPAPAPTPTPQQEMNVLLPLVMQGQHGETVKTVQVLCGRRGFFPGNSGTPESPDGIFGAATTMAVRECQSSFGFTGTDVDGRVGPKTWPRLISG